MDGQGHYEVEKVHNIVQKIGYPTKSPEIMDPPTLENYYDSVNVSSDTFFANAMAMRRFAIKEEWSALGKPVDRDQWDMTVPTG
jgi:endothelin-converting enzyme